MGAGGSGGATSNPTPAKGNRPGAGRSRPRSGGQMRNGCSYPTHGPQSEAGPLTVPRRSSDDDPYGSGGRHSETRLPARGPWLCVPDLRPVCLCRVAVGAPQDSQEIAIGKWGRGFGGGNVFQSSPCVALAWDYKPIMYAERRGDWGSCAGAAQSRARLFSEAAPPP